MQDMFRRDACPLEGVQIECEDMVGHFLAGNPGKQKESVADEGDREVATGRGNDSLLFHTHPLLHCTARVLQGHIPHVVQNLQSSLVVLLKHLYSVTFFSRRKHL